MSTEPRRVHGGVQCDAVTDAAGPRIDRADRQPRQDDGDAARIAADGDVRHREEQRRRDDRQPRAASEARQLLLPEAMGETFKVMALTRGLDAPLRGFQYQDLRRSL